MKLKSFNQFLTENIFVEENDLNKVYIALDEEDLEGDDFSYKKFCSSF